MSSATRIRRMALGIALLVTATGYAATADRPNILWLTAEDMSAQLGCFGDREARTPRLDAFALEAVRYSRAFATAPGHRTTLEKMRAELRRWQLETRDAGFLTEPQMRARLGPDGTPWSVARDETHYPRNI